MVVNSLPKTATRQHCGRLLFEPRPSAHESSTLTTRLPIDNKLVNQLLLPCSFKCHSVAGEIFYRTNVFVFDVLSNEWTSSVTDTFAGARNPTVVMSSKSATAKRNLLPAAVVTRFGISAFVTAIRFQRCSQLRLWCDCNATAMTLWRPCNVLWLRLRCYCDKTRQSPSDVIILSSFYLLTSISYVIQVPWRMKST